MALRGGLQSFVAEEAAGIGFAQSPMAQSKVSLQRHPESVKSHQGHTIAC